MVALGEEGDQRFWPMVLAIYHIAWFLGHDKRTLGCHGGGSGFGMCGHGI